MESSRADGTRVSAMAVGCPSETRMAGRAEVCKSCPGRELCQRQGVSDPDQKFIDVRMNAVRRKILILSGKGGVGKSSVASCLSMALASLSAKVGLVDVDICGPSAAKLMSIEGEAVVNSQYGWQPIKSPHCGVKVMSIGSLMEQEDTAVVWRGPRKNALIKRFLKDTFWGRLDYLIFDTPPGTSDEHLTVVKALMNARPEGAVIVTTPQDVALATIKKEINFCRKMKLEIIGIVENMSGFVCPCCKEKWALFSEGGAEKLAKSYELPFLGSIPLDPDLVQCCERGGNIFVEQPDSPAALALTHLANALHKAKT